jgi:hypothetical protein
MPLIDMEIFLFFDVFGIFVGFEFSPEPVS